MLSVDIGCGESAARARARSDVGNLVAALRAFHTEYGRFPSTCPNGLYVNEASHAALVRVLKAGETQENPRGVVFSVFFEESITTTKGGFLQSKRHNGRSSNSGAIIDPWGNFYRVALDADADGRVESPFSDEPPITTTPVIAWSLGDDGKQSGTWHINGNDRADDVVSWR